MASITPAQVPSNALPATNGTVERLFLWAGLLLKAHNGTKAAVEVEGGAPQELTQFQIFQSPDGKFRALIRVNIELDPLFVTDPSKKLWEFARELTTGASPSNYL